MQKTNLQLGFPANVVHIISPDSPLYGLSLAEMEARNFEVLVFVDGIDAMTSKQVQARYGYNASDIALFRVFAPMHLEVRGTKMGLDFGQFDDTCSVSHETSGGEYMQLHTMKAVPERDQPGLVAQMRHQTFKRLAEQLEPERAAAAERVAAAVAAGQGAHRPGGSLPLSSTPSGVTAPKNGVMASSLGITSDKAILGDNNKRMSSEVKDQVELLDIMGEGTEAKPAAAGGATPSGGGSAAAATELRELCAAILSDPSCNVLLKQQASAAMSRAAAL